MRRHEWTRQTCCGSAD